MENTKIDRWKIIHYRETLTLLIYYYNILELYVLLANQQLRGNRVLDSAVKSAIRNGCFQLNMYNYLILDKT